MRIKQFLKYPLPIFALLLGLFSTQLKADGLETHVVLRTSKGNMRFVLWPTVAPITVLNFIKLSQDGFYDGTYFHRIVRGFIAQGGDPLSRSDSINVGTGGPGYCIPAEFSDKKHKRGTLSMARRATNIDSAGSQFFICLNDAPSLDGHYTIFGELVDGWEVLDKVGNSPVTYSPQGVPERPLEKILITNASVSILTPPSPPDIESQESTPQPSISPANEQKSQPPATPVPKPVPAADSTSKSSSASDASAPRSSDASATQSSPAPAAESSKVKASQPGSDQQADRGAAAAPKSSENPKPAGPASSERDVPASNASDAPVNPKSASPAPQNVEEAETPKDSNPRPTEKSATPDGAQEDVTGSKSAEVSKKDATDRENQSGQSDSEEGTWDPRDASNSSQMVQSKSGKNYH